ncbi:MAG: SurA N-terminal domain-containing protein [Alphaproteobacteria bacterium]|nr:SurA N-terminal domain-containing protein [Alphaproteobacteria bacterium]
MLQALRTSTKSWAMKGLLGVLAISFVAFFGVSGNVGGVFTGNPNALVEVGSISYGQFEVTERYNQITNLYAQQLGSRTAITEEMRRQILSQTVDGIVVEGLFAQGAITLGLVASDALVAREIRAEPVFQAGGQFNEVAFRNYLLQVGQSEAQVVTTIRNRIIIQEQFFGSILGGITAPNVLAEYVYRYRDETRSAELVIFDAEAQGNVGTAGSAELAQYYADNEESFRLPPLRAATVLLITIESLAADMEIAEAEIEIAYEERQGRFMVPETRTLEQAIFAGEAAARSAYDAAQASVPFAEAVASNAALQGPSSLGSVGRQDLLDVQAGPAFAAEIGGVTEPIETDLGWILIHVVDSQGGTVTPFDEVHDVLRNELATEMAVDALYDFGDLVDDQLAGGATLDEAAAQVGLTVTKIPPVAADGTGETGDLVTSLPPHPELVSEIYALPPGEASQLIELGDDGLFFVQVDDAIDSRVPALGEIEARVQAAWQLAQRLDRARDRAEQVAESLRGGATSGQISRRFGHEVLDPGPFTRDGGLTGLPSQLIADIFDGDSGDVVTAELPNMVITARVTDIDVPTIGEDDNAWNIVLAQFEAALKQDLQAQFATGLRNQIDVDVNYEAVESIFFTR